MWITHSDRGAAAVEFALVVPFLLVLFCGMIDFGLAYNAKVTLTHATREGARVLALKQDATAAVARTQFAATGLAPVVVTTVLPASAACTGGADVKVTAEYDYQYITPLSALISVMPGGSSTPLAGPLKLTSEGVMRCGG